DRPRGGRRRHPRHPLVSQPSAHPGARVRDGSARRSPRVHAVDGRGVTATLIPFASLSESRWRNGAGRKVDIASGPGWLVGFAWLDGDAPFSDYRGPDPTLPPLPRPPSPPPSRPSH